MNDYAKNIIDQVINRPSQKVSDIPVSRPNYQRQKSKGRLMTFDIKPSVYAKHPEPVKSTSSDNSSSLRLVSLSANENRTYNILANKEPCTNTFKAKSNTKSVIIADADKKLYSILNLNYREGQSIGITSSEKSGIAHLFALESIKEQYPELQITYIWSNTGDYFEAKICGVHDTVAKALSCIESFSSDNKILECTRPQNILLRNLRIQTKETCALCNVTGIQFLPLINEYYKNNPQSMLEFIPVYDGLIVQGDMTEAKTVDRKSVV